MPQKNNQGGNDRGFASMPEEKQKEIARKGGEAVSEDREHMAEIGRKGGEARAEKDNNQGGGERGFAAMDEEKQREIARKGGQASGGGNRGGGNRGGGK